MARKDRDVGQAAAEAQGDEVTVLPVVAGAGGVALNALAL